jgi:cytoskeletal protein CcmA (bactofilin family)
VDGPVEGTAQVTIAAGARVGGEVRGRDVVVGGKLEHNVHATGTIHLLATADVRADLIAPRIAIDVGAQFEGQVRMVRPANVNANANANVKPVAPAPAGPREIPSLPAIGKRKIVRRTP